jgi:hypothetical protein
MRARVDLPDQAGAEVILQSTQMRHRHAIHRMSPSAWAALGGRSAWGSGHFDGGNS